MSTSLVLTIIGPDRPGLVEAVADAVAAHGANWEESRMAHLAGQFAGILRVSAPAGRLDALRGALGGLEGLRVVVADSGEAVSISARSLRLSIIGNDHPGIVRDLSHTLAGMGANVDALESSCEAAPMSGEALFRAEAELRLPEGVTLDALRGELERLAHDLMVDVNLDEAGD